MPFPQTAVTAISKPAVAPYSPNRQMQASRTVALTDESQKKSTLYRTTSLKVLGKDSKTSPSSTSTQPTNHATNDFSQGELVRYWIEYANSLTIEKIHLKNTLNSCLPVLKENFSFEVAVYNPSQKDEVEASKTQLIGHLSSKLNNNQIKMDIVMVEKEEIEMIYTASEKYDYLTKKNSNIEKLMELFNLSIE